MAWRSKRQPLESRRTARIDAGFFPKHIEPRPQFLHAPGVQEICSVSTCISSGPEDWIKLWLHNDLGWFNRMSDALRTIPSAQESQYRLFAYRMYPEVLTGRGRVPLILPDNVQPEPIPGEFRSVGFDSASKSMETVLGFECSPLSCNGMAAEISANEFCLFSGLNEAIAGAERFAAEQPEPGDYYVIEVLEGSLQ
jgi:hypothetical protein